MKPESLTSGAADTFFRPDKFELLSRDDDDKEELLFFNPLLLLLVVDGDRAIGEDKTLLLLFFNPLVVVLEERVEGVLDSLETDFPVDPNGEESLLLETESLLLLEFELEGVLKVLEETGELGPNFFLSPKPTSLGLLLVLEDVKFLLISGIDRRKGSEIEGFVVFKLLLVESGGFLVGIDCFWGNPPVEFLRSIAEEVCCGVLLLTLDFATAPNFEFKLSTLFLADPSVLTASIVDEFAC